MGEIKTLIQKLADTYGQSSVRIITVTVTSADEKTRTCIADSIDVQSGTDDIKVHLMTEVSDGFLVMPSKGATIEVCLSDVIEPFMIGFPSDIDKIFIVSGGKTFLIYSDSIDINGKNFGGLVQIAPLIEKINALEKLVNGFIGIYNTHTHPYTDSGTPLTTSPTTQLENNTLTITKRSDLENTSVNHGG